MSQVGLIQQQLYSLHHQLDMENARLYNSIVTHRGYSEKLTRLRSNFVMGPAVWDTTENRRREAWLNSELNSLEYTQIQCRRRIDMLESQITLTAYRLRREMS
jgi:hypothetical protein